MLPLDLCVLAPRPPRATLLGFYFLPRTIDKVRATLPGGKLGAYLDHDTGFSAWVLRRLRLERQLLQRAVADAAHEAALERWVASRVNLSMAPALNAKLETFVVSRMSADDQRLVRERHPVMRLRPELDSVLDILEADDQLILAAAP